MARNGAGVYSLPAGSTITNGDTSDASDLNTPLQDLETDANTARPIVAGGTGATSASGARTNLGLGALATLASVDTAQIADSAVETAKINDGAVTTAKIDDDAVTRAKIADAAMSGADATLITGTAGTNGNLAQWNGDGDLVDGPDVLDEDDMASDSATAVPTQQSVKAYVDANSASWTHSSVEDLTNGGANDLTELAFNSLPSGLEEIHIMLDQAEGGGGEIGFQVSTGTTYATSGYTSSSSDAGGEIASTSRFLISAGIGGADKLSGHYILTKGTGNKWYLGGSAGKQHSNGAIDLGGTLDGVKILIDAGTFDGGTIEIKYR